MGKSNRARQQILESARRCFSRDGLTGATVDVIAQEAGMAKSSLYYYYRGKEALIKAVLDEELTQVKHQIRQAMAQADGVLEEMRAFVLTRMRELSRMVNVSSALQDDYLRQYAVIDNMRKEYDQYEVALFQSLLEKGCREGRFNIDDPHLTALSLVTAMKGLEYEWVVKRSDKEMASIVFRMLDILFYGMVKRE